MRAYYWRLWWSESQKLSYTQQVPLHCLLKCMTWIWVATGIPCMTVIINRSSAQYQILGSSGRNEEPQFRRIIWGNSCHGHHCCRCANHHFHRCFCLHHMRGLSSAVGWKKQQIDINHGNYDIDYVRLVLQFEIFHCLEQKWTKSSNGNRGMSKYRRRDDTNKAERGGRGKSWRRVLLLRANSSVKVFSQ